MNSIARLPLAIATALLVCSFALAKEAARTKHTKKVAFVSEEEIARIEKELLEELPKDTPKKHLRGLAILRARQRKKKPPKQDMEIRNRSVGGSREVDQTVDYVGLYNHLSRTVSRGYAGQALDMAVALTDDSAWDTAAGDTAPLSVLFQMNVKPRWGAPRPLRDGETLHDTGGQDGKGDNYCIAFSVSSPCYVYIVQLDVTGRFYPLYPSRLFGSAANIGRPVGPGMIHNVPPQQQRQTMFFVLDRNRGDESVYFLATRKRRPEIEQCFAYFEQENSSLSDKPSRGLKRGARPELYRGPKGIASGPVAPGGAGQRPTVNPADLSGAKWYKPTTGDFLITRWFVHTR